jgi:hypothetical protein
MIKILFDDNISSYANNYEYNETKIAGAITGDTLAAGTAKQVAIP